jgi:GNAT superfamily N-acetyltransferase
MSRHPNPQPSPLDTALAEIRSWGPIGPVSGSIMPALGVLIGVRGLQKSSRIQIQHFWVSPDMRGTGRGRATLKRILEVADLHGLEVILRPSAYDHRGEGKHGPTTSELKRFYASMGFVKMKNRATNTGHMLRAPLV